LLVVVGAAQAEDRTAHRYSHYLHERADVSATFPWTDALAALTSVNATLSYTQILLDKLTRSLVQEPVSASIEACQPPPLMQADTIDCSKYPTAFTKATSHQVRRHEMCGVGRAH